MKKKTKKKPTQQQLVEKKRKKCVTKAKALARRRDKYKCRYCGEGEPNKRTHGSHVYSEGTTKHMSADVDNIICLCAAHHMNGRWNASKKDFNWHGSPAEALDWFISHFPDLHQRLKIRSRETHKLDMAYWDKKWEELLELEIKLDRGIENETDDALYYDRTTNECGDRAIENEIDQFLEEVVG